MTHLSDSALLVHLNVSQWAARKLDKRASAIVARAGEGSKGNFNKTLLPTCNELGVIHSETAEIRKAFRLNTLPWGIDGTFILPSSNYLGFMQEFRAMKDGWTRLVSAFIRAYPQAQLDAERILNSGIHDLYDRRDYPSHNEVGMKFGMELTVMPVPSAGDFRVDLAESEIESMRSDIEQRVAQSQQAAIKDVWQRLYDKVNWLHGRLADPKTTFHTETYNDAVDMVKLLTRLNFTGDANLESLRMEAENKLFSIHPESLRNDPVLREDTANEAKAISDKMAVFMGGL
jgi:hypothetical protein